MAETYPQPPKDKWEALHRTVRETTQEERAEDPRLWKLEFSIDWYDAEYGPGARQRDAKLIDLGIKLLLAAEHRGLDVPVEVPTLDDLKFAVLIALHPERYTGEPGVAAAEPDPIYETVLAQMPPPPPDGHVLYAAWKGLSHETFRAVVKASRDDAADPDDTGLSTNELLVKEYDQTSYLIEDLVAAQGFHATIAATKAGKTLLAVYKAIAVGAGLKVLGKETRQGKVVFIEEEGSPYFLRAHIQRILDALTDREGRQIEPEVHWFLRHQFNIASPQGIERLRRVIERERPTYLVLGPLSMLGHMTNENDAAEMQDRVRTLLSFSTDYGLTVDIAHHRNKPGQNRPPAGVGSFFDTSRGSSALIGGTDSATGLLRDPEEEYGKLFQLNRDSRAFVMNYRFDSTTLLHLPVDAEEVPNQTKATIFEVLDYLRAERRALVSDTAAKFGVSSNTARSRLDDIVQKGWAVVGEGPRKQRIYVPVEQAPATETLDDLAA
jgi:hypothetical protein